MGNRIQVEEHRRSFRNELLIFAVFLFLTLAMTWPWITHFRDAAPDEGDPYLVSWVLWWDFHQTFHDPVHLFQGNIFFPYKYSLAFSEHHYGLALPFFPLLALGVRPLTAQSLATLFGFAFCGYGAYRLARTLTQSAGAGWIAGIGFAFLPYRFQHISHLVYLSAGWIPLLLEALVLYVRRPTRKRALWLGTAFLMNGLSCIHWFVLTLLPLLVTGLLSAYRKGRELEGAFWRRGAAAVGGALILLMPFFVPYRRVAKLYGFVRSEAEAREYSAHLQHWLTADPRNHLWQGLGIYPAPGELALFPGLLLLLLPLAALLLVREGTSPDGSFPEPAPETAPAWLLPALDGLSVVAGSIALLACSQQPFLVTIRGRQILKASDPGRSLVLLAILLATRWWFAYPKAFFFLRERRLRDSLRNGRRPEALTIGLVWAALGFLGSLGMNTPFHRALWDLVFLYRSIRAPARAAMICDVGLALLAGLGALHLAEAVRERVPRLRFARAGVFTLLACALLFEQRVAPLELIHGEPEPDAVTTTLKGTPMSGGIAELPAGGPRGNYRYVLRAADHGKPLVTAVSGFIPPYEAQIEDLWQRSPIPNELQDLFEKIPVSYLVVHEAWLEPAQKTSVHDFLSRGVAARRLTFIQRFTPQSEDELYAVTRIEPWASTRTPLPMHLTHPAIPAGQVWREDETLSGSLDAPAEGGVESGILEVTGWGRIPGKDLDLALLIDGEVREPLSFKRVPRPDVARALPKLGDTAQAGFEARYPFLPTDGGSHEIQLILKASDGRLRHYDVRRFQWGP